MLKSDESLDWTFGARAELERTGIGHARVGVEMCRSASESGVWVQKYIILNIELAEQDHDSIPLLGSSPRDP